MKISSLYKSILCPRCQRPLANVHDQCEYCKYKRPSCVRLPRTAQQSVSGRFGGPFADKSSPTTTRHYEIGELNRPTFFSSA